MNDRAGAVKVGGYFTFEAINPDGSVAWREDVVPNGVVNGALDDVLSVYLAGGTQKTTWYLGLIGDASFSGLAAADTIASHTGWTESTVYNESARPTWSPGAVSGQSVTNSSGGGATFTMNATATIKGAFLASNATKGGTSGQLFATGLFSSDQSLVSGQVLKVTYNCSAASS